MTCRCSQCVREQDDAFATLPCRECGPIFRGFHMEECEFRATSCGRRRRHLSRHVVDKRRRSSSYFSVYRRDLELESPTYQKLVFLPGRAVALPCEQMDAAMKAHAGGGITSYPPSTTPRTPTSESTSPTSTAERISGKQPTKAAVKRGFLGSGAGGGSLYGAEGSHEGGGVRGGNVASSRADRTFDRLVALADPDMGDGADGASKVSPVRHCSYGVARPFVLSFPLLCKCLLTDDLSYATRRSFHPVTFTRVTDVAWRRERPHDGAARTTGQDPRAHDTIPRTGGRPSVRRRRRRLLLPIFSDHVIANGNSNAVGNDEESVVAARGQQRCRENFGRRPEMQPASGAGGWH